MVLEKKSFVIYNKTLFKTALACLLFVKCPECPYRVFLLSRLVPKPNCVKVPKEICVNTKKNPRRVKKPVVKEWCYRPKDLVENPESFPAGEGGNDQSSTHKQ